jgi:hypothetical protein
MSYSIAHDASVLTNKKFPLFSSSAGGLAEDIDNYLIGAPLIAGPPGTVYRLKRFVQRHRALVTGVAAIVAVLVAGIAAVHKKEDPAAGVLSKVELAASIAPHWLLCALGYQQVKRYKEDLSRSCPSHCGRSSILIGWWDRSEIFEKHHRLTNGGLTATLPR